MLSHYIKTAIQSQLRNKNFSIINLLGLSISFAASFLIINYVSFEFSFDKMHAKKDRIYRVESNFYEGKQLTDIWGTSSFGYGSAIKNEMTGVEDYVTIGVHNTEQTVSYKDTRSREEGVAYSTPSLFSVFDFKLLKGNSEDQLKRPNTVVITEDVAKRFFKNETPIGKQMTFASGTNFINCEVTGVLQNFPENSHIHFNYLISYATLPDYLKNYWYKHEAYTYLLLSPNKNPKDIEEAFPAVAEKHKTEAALRTKKWTVTLVPLTDIHLNPQKQYEKEIKGNRKSLITLICIAIVILLMALINYINLLTVRSIERAKEVGVRKVVGASRMQLINLHLVESGMIYVMSAGFAVLIILFATPFFNQIVGESIELYLFSKPFFWLSAIAVLCLGIVLSGLYPALMITRINPSVVLRGKYSRSNSAGTMRRVLVMFQFAASLFLICGTFVVYKQVKFMHQQALGVNIDQTIVLKFPVSRVNQIKQVNLFADNIKEITSIKSVAISSAGPGMEVALFASCKAMNKQANDRLYEMLTVDEGFTQTVGLKVIAGRPFQKNFGNERNNILVNEAALPSLGVQKPEETIGGLFYVEGETDPVTIIGVVKNWHQRGLANAFTPIVLINNERVGWLVPQYIIVKTKNTDYDTTLELIHNRWKSYFPEASFSYFFLDSYFDAQYKADKRFGTIVGIFTALAFFISLLGLWTLTAFSISKKEKEIGIRKIHGATSYQVMYLFSKEIVILIFISSIIATPLSYITMTNWLEHYAFRTNISLWLYVIGSVITFSIAIITVCWLSWKAATTNPIETLKNE